MDVRARLHYVAGAMELILALLSLLTAATGALTGARAPDAGFHEAAQVDTIRAAAPAAARAVRSLAVSTVAPAAPRAAIAPLPAFAVAPAVPLYTDRLIE